MITPPLRSSSILMAGLPRTGKTTYLALLYLAIVSDRAPALRLGSFADDREYLNRISGQLQRCEATVHTEVGEREELSLSLLVGSEALPTTLRIPDMSGETWDMALVERHWTRELDDWVREAAGAILFVHPKDFDSGTTIREARAAEEALGHKVKAPAAGDSVAPTSRAPHHHSPTQVALVELIQLLREERGPRPARGCLVISAYDLVAPGTSPDDWVRLNCPLLAQYLDVNRAWLEFAVFGVSAQGGDFAVPMVQDALLEQDALDRARVLRGDGSPVGPEAPILNLLSIDG